ncbi:AAA family ATPase [Pseudomonas gingeri]
MQRFDRSFVPVPEVFQGPDFAPARRQLREFFLASPEKRAQTRLPDSFDNFNETSILLGLQRLFHGKCAFCESAGQTEPYQFRPPSNAAPSKGQDSAHLYYAWLRHAWENIYPICTACIPDQPRFFPVKGKRAPLPDKQQLLRYEQENLGLWRDHPPKEKNLLLDPCVDNDFARHFDIDLSSGELVGLSAEGLLTAQHFNLNRSALCAQRGTALHRYMRTLIERTFEQLMKGDSLTHPGYLAIFDFSGMEFGGIWYLLCCRVVSALTLSGEKPLPVSRLKIAESFMVLARDKRFSQRLSRLRAWYTDASLKSVRYVSESFTGASERFPSLLSIQLNHFKGIEQLSLNLPVSEHSQGFTGNAPPLQPALLILGENAAGKSSLLEATALALCTDKARAELQLDVSALPLNPELMGAASLPQAASASVTLTFEQGVRRTLTIADGVYLVEGPSQLPPVFAYGAFRQYQKGVRRFSAAKSIINLFQSDVLLSNPEKWLLSLKEPDFKMVVRALRDVLSIEGEFDVMVRDQERQRCLIVTTTAGCQTRHETPLSLASSGYRSILAMVCDIMQGLMNRQVNPFFDTLATAQAIVLIDEVEAHLHPRWKIQIMRALRSALPKVTFIATTHDPLCLRGMQAHEVIVMHRVARDCDPQTQLPVMVEQLVELPDVSQLTIEQLLTSDFFSLTSTDQPGTERELARFADILAAREQNDPLNEAQLKAWARFERDISDALPVGSTEVQRLVQEAVVEYLKNRRQASSARLGELRSASRQRILDILESL